MTERPGRKALFTGAMIPKKTEADEKPDNDRIHRISAASESTLKNALNGTDSPINPQEFPPEFNQMIATVNDIAREIISTKHTIIPDVTEVSPAGNVPCLDSASIIEGCPVPSVLLDDQGLILCHNAEFQKLSGYSSSDILGKTFDELPVDLPHGNPVKEVVSEKKQTTVKGTGHFPSGTRLIDIFAVPLKRKDGSIEAIQVILQEDIPKGSGDISQKDALEKIEQLKKRAQTIVQENPMPIVLTDTSFTLKVVNDAYVELTGIPRKELLDKNLHDFRILKTEGEDLKNIINTKLRFFNQVTIDYPSGTRILKQYGIPILDPSGNLKEILIVYNDITEECREMDEVERLQKRSEVIVQENPFAILLTDPKYHIIEANPAFLAMSGFIRQKIISMTLSDIKVLSKDGDGVGDAVEKRARVFGTVTVELPSGTRTLEQHVIPLVETDGSLKNILIIYNDITSKQTQDADIKKKMDQIAVLKKRSDLIIQQNPMPMMVMDLQFKILLANDAYATMSGIQKERLLEMNAKSFQIIEQKGDGLKQVLEQKRRIFGEVTVEFPIGRKTLEQYGLPLFDDKGNLAHILTVYNDVTKNREQEKKIADMIEEAKSGREILTASAGELETAMASVAAGDLTHQVSIDDADPLVKLKRDYNQAIDAIRIAMEELDSSLIQLEKTIGEMTRSTNEILKATEQVADAAQNTSANTSSNLGSMEKLNADVSEISASIQEIASTSQDVMHHAEKAAEEGHTAVDLGNAATGKMQKVEKISQQSVTDITRLNDQMREINKIVNLIADIASQTNLLALNAAIEAARAGEHGRGFAVVAGEVKSLAGESKNASTQIENLIKSIQNESEKTAASMRDSYSEIKSGIDSVNQTIDSLNRIVTEAEVVSQGIQQITKATMDQADAANRVMNETEESRSFAKQNLSRLQDMAALAQETNASTEEIARGATTLGEMSHRLSKIRQKFKLR